MKKAIENEYGEDEFGYFRIRRMPMDEKKENSGKI